MRSRKQVLAQIAVVNNVLQQNQRDAVKQQRYFQRHSTAYSLLIAGAILIPLVWFGWRMRGERWVNKLAVSLMDVVTLVSMNYFKRQLNRLFQ